jgi:hypothetical protein
MSPVVATKAGTNADVLGGGAERAKLLLPRFDLLLRQTEEVFELLVYSRLLMVFVFCSIRLLFLDRCWRVTSVVELRAELVNGCGQLSEAASHCNL